MITWTCTPRPDLGKVAWDAKSQCPHGDAGYVLFASTPVLLEQVTDLAEVHRQQMECACPMGELIVETAPPPEENDVST